MRRNKFNIILSILVVVINIFSFNICNASNVSKSEYIAKFLINIGAMNGYPDGELRLNNTITREEFSKLIVLASSFKDSLDLSSKSSPFIDVTKDRWSSPYVKVATQNGILKGFPDLTFRPESNIKVEEACVIGLRLLNYTSSDYGTSWPYSQIAFAKQKDILNNVDKNAGADITRGDAINIIYNILCSNINNQNIKYINLLDYSLIDDVIVISSSIQDASISTNQIVTSKGTYECINKIEQGSIGSKSKLIVNESGKVISIIPENQNSKTYTLLSISDNGIVVLENGIKSNISCSSDITAYYKSQKTTLKNISSVIPENSSITVSYNDNIVDYVLVQELLCNGPYVVNDTNWSTKYNIPSDVTIIKDGLSANISDVNLFDVIYYYNANNEIVVYDDKISGEIEEILPSIRNANSITLGGKNYTFETNQAYISLQKFEKGDIVTILLGKEGNIVDIAKIEDIKTEQIGFVLEAGTKTLKNSKNESYSKYYVKVLLINGSTSEYLFDKSCLEYLNKVVNISYNQGKTYISSAGRKTDLSGKVDSSNKKIGSNKLTVNINILEIPKTNDKYISKPIKVNLSRLNNINLSSSNIIYYTRNSNSEIDNLIITDVTNDMYDYALILNELDLSYTSINTSYTYMIGSNILTSISKNVKYNINVNEPAGIIASNGEVLDILKLSKLSNIKNITEYSFTSGNNKYTITSDVIAYKRVENTSEYLATNLSYAIENQNNYIIYAYYDKLPENGGKIRVLLLK